MYNFNNNVTAFHVQLMPQIYIISTHFYFNHAIYHSFDDHLSIYLRE